MYIIIYIIIGLYLIITLNYTIKYFIIKKVINKPIRSGYYEDTLKYGSKYDKNDEILFTPRIYVEEIDRYTNGTSKIKIHKIEYRVSESKIEFSRVDKFIRDDFSEIIDTNKVIWLDSENDIKQVRKQKLDKITKRKFFNIF